MRHPATQPSMRASILARLFVALLLAFACSAALPQTARANDGSEATGAPLAAAAQVDGAIDTDIVPTTNQMASPEKADLVATPAPDQPTPSDQLASPQAASPDESPASAAKEPSLAQDVQDVLTTTTFAYEHDPRDNPSAMADIIEDANAVYGFSPSPDGSLKGYVDYDWSDPDLVEGGRQQRIAYHESLSELYDIIDQMRADGASSEQIARTVSTRRNELRLEAYANNPEGLAAAKARNLELYGNENGGTPEYFLERYGSWEKVIEKSLSVNSGMDACMGLYDMFYAIYVAAGQVSADEPMPTDDGDGGPVDEGDGTEREDNEKAGDVRESNDAAASPQVLEGATAHASAAATQPLPATGDDLPLVLPVALLLLGSTLATLGIRLRTTLY